MWQIVAKICQNVLLSQSEALPLARQYIQRSFQNSKNHSKNPKIMEEIKVEFKPKGLEMEVNKQNFALALKTWRLRQGLTQIELGKRWGCSRWTIIRAEQAKNITWEIAYKMFAKLARELANENKEAGL
jgi:DNA-binding XRE family transcriptional regulator